MKNKYTFKIMFPLVTLLASACAQQANLTRDSEKEQVSGTHEVLYHVDETRADGIFSCEVNLANYNYNPSYKTLAECNKSEELANLSSGPRVFKGERYFYGKYCEETSNPNLLKNMKKGEVFNTEADCKKAYATKAKGDRYKSIAAFLIKYPQYSIYEKNIKQSEAVVGMPKAVLKMSWGQPQTVNKTITQFGVSEQWVYGSGNYVYLKGDVVTSMQTSR